MTVLKTIAPKEDFIVQINGDYNVPFEEITLAAPQSSGDVILSGAEYQIVAEDGLLGDHVRAMVKGNPTTVNYKALDFSGVVEATAIAALKEQGIIVVNKP